MTNVDLGPPLQTSTRTYIWQLTAFQQQGTLWLGWSTDSRFSTQQGQIVVYDGLPLFPANPHLNQRASKSDTAPNPWNTGLPWRAGWHCAWIAHKSPDGPHEYVVRLVTA